MKLYTEEDLKKVISIYSEEYKTSTDEILNELNLTPIELPSEEEIDAFINKNFISHGEDNWQRKYFKAGVKWIKDKIQGGNK